MGRLSTCGKLELHWNAAGRLEKAVNDGQATTFAYDAFGRRIEKRSQDAVDKFYWDGESLALEVRSHAEEEDESKEHILFPGTFEPLALIRRSRGGPASVYLYHTDPNGSPVRLTDCEGRVVWSANYHPDGSADVEFGGSLTNLRLQGQYFDSETLLQHRYFRYYLPDRGCFITPDPLGLFGGLDLYAFGPNTYAWLDPLGLRCGRVALDNIAIIALLEGNRFDRRAILRAIGNRRPVIPRTAMREFLQGGGNRAALQRFLARTEGEVVHDANTSLTRRMMERGIDRNDAIIVATARRQGVDLLTRDNKVLRRAPDIARIF